MKPQRQRITIQEFINTIQTPSDILKAVSSSSDYSEELNSDNAKSLFEPKQKKRITRFQSHFSTDLFNMQPQTTPIYNQMAALILMIPVKHAPLEIFKWCQKLFPFLNSFSQIISAGLMMRFAESSLILNQVESALQTMRWGLARYDFIVSSYLYLCASSKNPIEYEITSLTNYSRVDCMSFYYLGVNLMMLHKYEKALNSFLHSLTLNSPSDCLKEIASDFALSCFLNHYDEQQTRLLISDKFDISDDVTELFSIVDEIELNNDDESQNYSDVFVFLIDDINKEIRRRRIIKFVSITYRIPIDLLVQKTKLSDVKTLIEYLDALKNENVISYRIKKGVVYFSQPIVQPVIDKQYSLLMKSMNELKKVQQKNSQLNQHQNKDQDEEEDFFF